MGRGGGGKESKFLIKGGHYTSEDVLSITSHPRQPTTAKTLPCKSKGAPARGHASAGPSRSPPRGDGRIRSEPPALLFAPFAPPWDRNQGFFSSSWEILSPERRQAASHELLIRTRRPGFSRRGRAVWRGAAGRGTQRRCLR